MPARKKKKSPTLPRTIPAPAEPKFVQAACRDTPDATGAADQQPLASAPYLIQRCTMRQVALDAIVGFDSAFSHDYMGSAEFEFGSLPASLRAVAEAFPRYVVVDTGHRSVDGAPLFLVCHEKHQQAVIEALPSLIDRTARTKEGVRLSNRLAGEDGYDNDLWWDIENHWFVALGVDQAVKLRQAFHMLRQKWGYSAATGAVVPA